MPGGRRDDRVHRRRRLARRAWSRNLGRPAASSTTTSARTNFPGAGGPPRCTTRRPAHISGTLPPVEYPGHYIPKRVTNAGTIWFKTRLLFIANSLKQHVLGLEEVDDGVWSIYFCHVLLARIDERDYVLRA